MFRGNAGVRAGQGRWDKAVTSGYVFGADYLLRVWMQGMREERDQRSLPGFVLGSA